MVGDVWWRRGDEKVMVEAAAPVWTAEEEESGVVAQGEHGLCPTKIRKKKVRRREWEGKEANRGHKMTNIRV